MGRWVPFALWAAALGAWGWLWRGARGRARLLDRLSARHGGFVRSGFSWLTLMPEPREVSFIVVVAGAPCRLRVGFLLPPDAGPIPCTLLEMDLPGTPFGPDPGGFNAEDMAGGRGLFLAGTNVTAAWGRFLGDLPPGTRPRLRWGGATLQLTLPGLLTDEEELWINRAVGFLEEAAVRILPAPRQPSRP